MLAMSEARRQAVFQLATPTALSKSYASCPATSRLSVAQPPPMAIGISLALAPRRIETDPPRAARRPTGRLRAERRSGHGTLGTARPGDRGRSRSRRARRPRGGDVSRRPEDLRIRNRSLVEHHRVTRRAGSADDPQRRPDERALKNLVVDKRFGVDVF